MRRRKFAVAFVGAAIASWRAAQAKSIKALGIELPPTLSIMAGEVIE